MYDLSRGDITIQEAAAITAVLSGFERLGFDKSTLWADLARTARIDFDQLTTGAFSLVAKHRNDLSPRGIIDMLGEHPGRQAFDAEVLDCDSPETIDDVSGLFVAEIPPAVTDPGMIFGEGSNALQPSFRASLATGDSVLPETQTLCGALRPVRSSDRFAVAQGDNAGQPHIDADALLAGAVDGFDIYMEDDVPFTSIPRQNRGSRLARQTAVPAGFDLAVDSDDADLAGFADGQSVADAEVCSAVAGGCAKTWKSRLGAALNATEECPEPLIKLSQYLLLCRIGPTTMRVLSITPDYRKRCHLLVAVYRDALAVCRDAVFQRGVVEMAEIVQHLAQRADLSTARIDPIFVAEYHAAGSDPVVSGRRQERVVGLPASARSSFIRYIQRMGKGVHLIVGYKVDCSVRVS